MTKRLICLALALIMITAVLVSCKKDEQPEQTEGAGTVDTRPTDTRDPDTILELPDDIYFDGEDFTMLLRSDRNGAPDEFDVDYSSQDADVVDQAVYDRQLTLQSELGISFVYSYVKEADILTTIANSVAGGSNDYDISCPAAYQAPTLAIQGTLYNWLDVPYVNMEKAWWGSRSGLADSLTVSGMLPFITGDASNLSIGKYMGVFFNKEYLSLYAHMTDEDLYNTVKNGEWTIDKLIELSKLATVDLVDGNVKDENDLYGCNFYLATICDNYFAAFDIDIVTQNNEGGYEIALNTPQMDEAVEKLINMVYGANCTWLGTDKSNCIEFFAVKQHSMFTHGGLEWATEFLAKNFSEFGIVPYPKLNQDQESYATALSDVYSVFTLDVSASESKVNKVGAVLEYMGYLSYEKTTYAYFDVVLKGRAAADPTAVEMLDLLHDGAVYNMGFMYSSALNNPAHIFRSVLEKDTATLGTWTRMWSSRGRAYNTKLGDLIDKLAEFA